MWDEQYLLKLTLSSYFHIYTNMFHLDHFVTEFVTLSISWYSIHLRVQQMSYRSE